MHSSVQPYSIQKKGKIMDMAFLTKLWITELPIERRNFEYIIICIVQFHQFLIEIQLILLSNFHIDKAMKNMRKSPCTWCFKIMTIINNILKIMSTVNNILNCGFTLQRFPHLVTFELDSMLGLRSYFLTRLNIVK